MNRQNVVIRGLGLEEMEEIPAPGPGPQPESALAPLAAAEGRWFRLQGKDYDVPGFEGELWTARQRQAHPLHEISYRACYKPQLPRHFIAALTAPGERIYDPFGGRGTTALEAALMGRRVASNDVNPLAAILLAPRLAPPDLQAVERRLGEIPWMDAEDDGLDLSMFFHPETEGALRGLRTWILRRESEGSLDAVDRWIRMVATNRLTGHSAGFFSVYTLPPNQAASQERQRVINAKRNQTPPFRDVASLILRKSRQLQKALTEEDRRNLACAAAEACLLTGDAARTPDLAEGSVALTVTSPPFLDVVQYAADNWMRCWFNGLDAEAIGRGLTQCRTVQRWSEAMAGVFLELFRVTRPGGHVAFEVGEVRKGTVRLEDEVLPLACAAGFEPLGLLLNTQTFTKTAHIWGVENMAEGTNSNRIVVMRRP